MPGPLEAPDGVAHPAVGSHPVEGPAHLGRLISPAALSAQGRRLAGLLLPLVLLGWMALAQAMPVGALDRSEMGSPDALPSALAPLQAGAQLFEAHCVGCHVGGGNIIRRGRTLKLAALERNGLADPEAIARVAAEGIGQMSGYAPVLGEDGPRLVADWVWLQARSDWPRPPRLEPLPQG